jgi:hypothetical protein
MSHSTQTMNQFIETHLVYTPAGPVGALHTSCRLSEIYHCYEDFCLNHNIQPPPFQIFKSQLACHLSRGVQGAHVEHVRLRTVEDDVL